MTSRLGGKPNREAVDLAEQITDEHREMPDRARDDLLSFISAGKPDGLMDYEWQERVNVVLNALRVQGADTGERAAGLTELLMEMAASDPDPILRMYAMQHLALWYPRIRDADERRQVLGLLKQILDVKGERSRGSALQALSDIARNGAHQEVELALEGSPIVERAKSILSDQGETADVRICALQACVVHAHEGVLVNLRAIATNADENTVLRKAALHGLGGMGGAQDVDLLELVGNEDSRCAAAAQAALDVLRKRFPSVRPPGAKESANTF